MEWLLLRLIVMDRYSILPALSLDGILHLDVIQESWKGATFYRFIEEAFSAINAWIRSNRDYARSELSGNVTADPYTMIWKAVFMTVTPIKVEGWNYRDCGYLA